MTECKECGLTYLEHDPGDRRKHASYHRRWQTATTALGYRPSLRREREQVKQECWLIVNSKEHTPEQKLSAAERIIRAWFDRSLETAIGEGYWLVHPAFAAYAAMLDLEEMPFPDDVVERLRAKYGRIEGEIAPGDSYWYPPGSKGRFHQFLRRR